jgi:hypothetical protein
MKRILKLDHLRLRGLSGAHDECMLTATVQNMRRMAKLPVSHRQIAGWVCLHDSKSPEITNKDRHMSG